MAKRTPPKLVSVFDVGIEYTESPMTHIFYEYDGPRVLDVEMLIMHGITLWHERMKNHPIEDLSYIWAYATSLLDAPPEPHLYSRVEWLRYQVMMGAIRPHGDSIEPYPYKNLLIAAIYLQEAQKLCEQSPTERAWHITVMAFYQLGLATTPTVPEMASKAAKERHQKENQLLRHLVLVAIERIVDDPSIKSIATAKDRVEETLRADAWVRKTLDIPTHPTKDDPPDKLQQLRNTLDTWAKRNGPYPEISDAFAQFSRGKGGTNPTARRTTPAGVPLEALPEEYAHYMRIINFKEDGYVLTAEISQNKPDEESSDTAI